MDEDEALDEGDVEDEEDLLDEAIEDDATLDGETESAEADEI